NATFYKIPEPETVGRWAEQVPSDFKFVVKIPKQISHDQPLTECVKPLGIFLENLRPFREKLGLVFLQLPPHFGPDRRSELAFFCREFQTSGFKLAIEFRERSWFDHGVFNLKAAQWFSDQGISLVITDTTTRRDVSHSVVTTDSVMVRFLGNELHPTDYSRIDAWVERLAAWAQSGVREIYFFMHQPEERTAPDLLNTLYKRIESMDGISARFSMTADSVSPSASQISLF
ncbi:MAG: DUF72 domain-containing protein, partial [Proteobacteria bacterium]